MWRRIVLLIGVISLLLPQVHGLVPHHHHKDDGNVAQCHDPAPRGAQDHHHGFDDPGEIHDLAAHLASSPEKPKVKPRTVIGALLPPVDFFVRFIAWPPRGRVDDASRDCMHAAPAGSLRNRAPPAA